MDNKPPIKKTIYFCPSCFKETGQMNKLSDFVVANFPYLIIGYKCGECGYYYEMETGV